MLIWRVERTLETGHGAWVELWKPLRWSEEVGMDLR